MHAIFAPQQAIGKVARDLDLGRFDPGHIARLTVQFGDLVAFFLSPHHIHAQQHFRPVATLGAAGAGVDLEDGAQLVFLAVKGGAEFEVFQGFYRFGKALVDLRFAGFPFAVEIEEYLRIFHEGLHFFEARYPVLMALEFLQNSFSALRVIPELGIEGLLFFVFDLEFPVIDVKDTSLRDPDGF